MRAVFPYPPSKGGMSSICGVIWVHCFRSLWTPQAISVCLLELFGQVLALAATARVEYSFCRSIQSRASKEAKASPHQSLDLKESHCHQWQPHGPLFWLSAFPSSGVFLPLTGLHRYLNRWLHRVHLPSCWEDVDGSPIRSPPIGPNTPPSPSASSHAKLKHKLL
jgi:hypothetical protein